MRSPEREESKEEEMIARGAPCVCGGVWEAAAAAAAAGREGSMTEGTGSRRIVSSHVTCHASPEFSNWRKGEAIPTADVDRL